MSRVDHVIGVKAEHEVSVTTEAVRGRQPASAVQIANVAASFKSCVDLGICGLQLEGCEFGFGGRDGAAALEESSDGDQEFQSAADEGQPVHVEARVSGPEWAWRGGAPRPSSQG